MQPNAGQEPPRVLPTEFRVQASQFELNPNLSLVGGREAAVWLPTKLATAVVQIAPPAAADAPKAGKKKSKEPEPPQKPPDVDRTPTSVPVLLRNEGCGVRLHALDGSGLDVRTKIDISTFQPTCMDLRPALPHELEKGTSALVAVGLYSGECALIDPVAGKILTVWNKEHMNAKGKVTSVSWVPKMEWQCAVAYSSGVTLFFDIERSKEDVLAESKPVIKGPTELNVLHPKSSKHNPRMRWNVGPAAVRCLRFSPDGSMAAIASQDGLLRICDAAHEELIIAFRSYFGGLLCTAWSPDSQFVVAGGEDDTVSIWKVGGQQRGLVGRCNGHVSWVSDIGFDLSSCNLAAGLYRFASVGLDTQLLVWEFTNSSTDEPAGPSPPNLVVVPPAASGDKSVANLSSLVTVEVHAKPLSCIVLTLTGDFITGCEGNEIKFWRRGDAESSDLSDVEPQQAAGGDELGSDEGDGQDLDASISNISLQLDSPVKDGEL